MPKQICLECYAKVQDTYKFLQQCLNSEKQLRDHATKVNEKTNESLPVISESVYEQDCTMTELSVTRSTSKRGIVSRVKDFFESRTLKKRLSKESVTRVLDFEQTMSYEEASFVPQDATINSTVVTDLDEITEEIVPDAVPADPVQVRAPVTLRRTSSRRQFKCLYQSCSLKFETKMERRKHLESHLSAGACVTRSKSTWKCKHCDLKFQNPELLVVHEKIHLAQILHECNKCCKKFKTKANLTAHQRFHSIGSKEKHKCKICLKEFTHVSTLYVHQIIHKPDVAQALVTFRS